MWLHTAAPVIVAVEVLQIVSSIPSIGFSLDRGIWLWRYDAAPRPSCWQPVRLLEESAYGVRRRVGFLNQLLAQRNVLLVGHVQYTSGCSPLESQSGGL